MAPFLVGGGIRKGLEVARRRLNAGRQILDRGQHGIVDVGRRHRHLREQCIDIALVHERREVAGIEKRKQSLRLGLDQLGDDLGEVGLAELGPSIP